MDCGASSKLGIFHLLWKSSQVQVVLYFNVKEQKMLLVFHFAQWSADNVDQNIITLDGKNTLHGMGIVVPIPSADDKLVASLPQIRRKDS